MAYTTEAAVRIASGFANTTNITTGTITAYLADADSVINAAIADRYTIPLTVSGVSASSEIIETLARHIVVGLLYSNEYGEESEDTDKGWEKRLEWAMKQLEKIQNGGLKLYNSSGVELDRSTLHKPVFSPTSAQSDESAENSKAPKLTMNQDF